MFLKTAILYISQNNLNTSVGFNFNLLPIRLEGLQIQNGHGGT